MTVFFHYFLFLFFFDLFLWFFFYFHITNGHVIEHFESKADVECHSTEKSLNLISVFSQSSFKMSFAAIQTILSLNNKLNKNFLWILHFLVIIISNWRYWSTVIYIFNSWSLFQSIWKNILDSFEWLINGSNEWIRV